MPFGDDGTKLLGWVLFKMALENRHGFHMMAERREQQGQIHSGQARSLFWELSLFQFKHMIGLHSSRGMLLFFLFLFFFPNRFWMTCLLVAEPVLALLGTFGGSVSWHVGDAISTKRMRQRQGGRQGREHSPSHFPKAQRLHQPSVGECPSVFLIKLSFA